MIKTQELQHVVWQEGRHYVAQCLVDISSFGGTEEEALKNLDEALELYFEDEPIEKVIKIERPLLVQRPLRHA